MVRARTYTSGCLGSGQRWRVLDLCGLVVGRGEHETVGPEHDIVVPPMFFKIVIREGTEEGDLPIVLAFLFPHQRARHGELENFLVSVDVIEALTNLDFFNEIGDEVSL